MLVTVQIRSNKLSLICLHLKKIKNAELANSSNYFIPLDVQLSMNYLDTEENLKFWRNKEHSFISMWGFGHRYPQTE